jgi:hypothetical protein
LSYSTPEKDDEPSRELSIGEIFSRSFDLARRNYLQLLPIFVGFGALAALVSTYVRAITPPLVIPTNVSSLTQSQELAVAASLARFLEIRTFNYFVAWLILYFAAGIGVWKIFQIMGQKKKLTFELPQRGNLVPVAVTVLLTIVCIELSSVLLFVGLLIFATMFYVAFSAAVAEGKYFLSSLGRSRSLTSGKMGKTFIVFAGVQLFVYIVARVFSTIVSLLPISSLAANATLNFVLALEFPFVSASMVILYLSYRRGQEWVAPKPPSLYDEMRSQPMGAYGPQSQGTKKFCSACGAAIMSDERFCHNCGAALSTQY